MSQPNPIKTDNPHIVDLVAEDLFSRKEKGLKTYGHALTAHNGRNALQDAYEEILDFSCYFKQYMEEQKMKTDLSFIKNIINSNVEELEHQYKLGNIGWSNFQHSKLVLNETLKDITNFIKEANDLVSKQKAE